MSVLGMNDLRKGVMIIFEGEPYEVTTANFLRKQQRRPVMRTVLKHLKTGRTREHTFQQSDKVEEAGVDRHKAQFLYRDARAFVFMDAGSYEQMELPPDAVGEAATYLIEGQVVEIMLLNGQPLTIELPIKIERRVVETSPGVRGDTAGNVMKEATVEGGVKVRVPLFINEGDIVRIDTRSGTYVERA